MVKKVVGLRSRIGRIMFEKFEENDLKISRGMVEKLVTSWCENCDRVRKVFATRRKTYWRHSSKNNSGLIKKLVAAYSKVIRDMVNK